MHDRWRAARDEIAQGKTRETAFEDAATRLVGTPAVCGPDMVKKDFDAVQKARRGRLLPPFHYDRYVLSAPRRQRSGASVLDRWRRQRRQRRVILADQIT